jgi:membrane-bound ClpP family serine protease
MAFGISTPFGFAAIVCVMIAAPLAVMFFFYVARKTSLVLGKVQESAYASSASREYLMGKTGVASSFLRPAGVAAIDGKRIDVTAEAEFIAEGTRVEVVRVDGIKVVVREVKK